MDKITEDIEILFLKVYPKNECFQQQILKKKIFILKFVKIATFYPKMDDDDDFGFNDASTHEGHLRQNGIST